MTRRLLGVAGIAVTACAVAACATMRVSSHVERGRDFSQYRTFDWGPADALPTGDPRLDKDPFFQDHVEGAIEKQMAARGFERSAVADAPDVRIHYHATIDQRIAIDEVDRRYGDCYSDECYPHVTDYEAGTLVVDIVDVRTNALIWRGWAQKSVEGVLGNRDRLARTIDEGVTRMFLRLPRAR
ncbi:MAG TPA: DUF4136 domain-containing protein [Vicinamibacterales bacterium]|nr:DUF4136 domain-containing protein [Vicinamibacterales bacterium]